VRSSIRVWTEGDGPRRSLKLARGGVHADGTPRYDTTNLTASDVFRDNEISSAVIRWDDRGIVNAPIVIGGVRAYEMTVPLWPGWLPTANLDNVDGPDRVAAKELALTPLQAAQLGDLAELNSWFRQYHREGSEFAEHRFVGRRWVLNEDGRFDGATYNRNAPFDDYQPFDFSTVASGEVTRRGQWSRRSRRLLPTITRSELGARFGVYVQISFDGGVTWFVPQGAISVLQNPTSVVLEVSSPTQITPPGIDPLEMNLWYALIDQTFRARVTAVIEGDERLTARPAPDESRSPTLQTTSRVWMRAGDYQYVTRQGTSNVLSGIHPTATDIDRDDSAAIERFAVESAERTLDRRVVVSPVIPWLAAVPAVGDEIGEIQGRGVSLVTRGDGESFGPVVVGKRFRFHGQRWETMLELERSKTGSAMGGEG